MEREVESGDTVEFKIIINNNSKKLSGSEERGGEWGEGGD